MRVFIIAALLITITIFLGYNNTWDSPFLFDDNFTIVGDNYVENFSFAAADFKALLGTRGLRDVTFGMNYYFSGRDVTPYHVVNTLLHIVASILVFWVARLLSRLAWPEQLWPTSVADVSNHDLHGLLVALLFALHPIQTMSVTNITQRSGLFLAVFYLLALGAFIKARLSPRPRRWWVVVGVSLALALISRENAATLPFALALIEWIFLPDSKRYWRQRWRYVVPLGVLALYVPLRYLGLVPLVNFNPLVISEWSTRLAAVDIYSLFVRTELIEPWQYMLTEPRVIVRYLSLLWWPVNQNADWDIPLSTSLWQPFTTLFSLLAVLALAGLGVWLKSRAKLAAFGSLFFLLALSIESSVIILPDVMFEYRLYLPLLGMAFVALELITRFKKQPAVLVLALVVATSILTVATFRRNTVWATDVSLWSDVVAKSPNVRRAHKNLSVGLLQVGELQLALHHAEWVIELEPDHASGYRNLGAMLAQAGRLEEAETALERALELEPDHPGAYNNLGNAYALARQWTKAAEAFRRSIELKPAASTHQNLATAYVNLNRFQEAITHYEIALTLEPGRRQAAEQLAVIRQRLAQ